jgi:bisphosphoglycerate-dependent phosphoglycerate mutase
MQRVFVATRPEAEHRVQRLVGGWYDSHLTEKGKTAAQLIARRLKQEIADARSAFTPRILRVGWKQQLRLRASSERPSQPCRGYVS